MADRNLLLDYRTSNSHWSEKQRLCYMCHGALKTLELCGDELILSYETDEADVEREILSISDKVDETFLTYSRVVEERSGFKNRIRSIVFRKIKA